MSRRVCGVIGFVGQSGANQAFDVEAGLTALAHRGPDDRGQSVSAGPGWTCTLGHVRLSIIDLSPLGHQPMVTPDGRYQITFNGEIYNYRALRDRLAAEGVQFRSTSDTEVILQGYATWGPRIVSELRGMFAFGIWDAEEEVLFLARDRLGKKPLYVVGDERTWVGFASELRALLAAGLAARVLSEDGVRSYLAWGSCAEPLTILRDVRMLEPGTTLRFQRGLCERQLYWRPALRSDVTRFEEAVEVVRPVLREAVALRLVADVPIGVFLSGGIDSSVVAGLAAERTQRTLHTFTIGFRERDADESVFAAEFARAHGCEHHPIRLEAAELAERIEDVALAQDQPSADGLNTFFVAEAVRDAGISVALSGLGGDELFGGYRNFRFFEAATWLAGARPLAGVTGALARVAPVASWSRKLSRATALLEAPPTPVGAYGVLRAMFDPRQVEALTGATPPRGSAVDGRFSALQSDPISEFSALELRNYLQNTLLRDADVMSMAHGVEVRVPLMDHVLVETVLPLAGHLKVDWTARRNKPLLCDAGPLLSRSTTNRRKMGFALPVDRWLLGPVRPFVERMLDGMPREGLVRRSAAREVWHRFVGGHVNAWRVWCLLSLLSWCEHHRVPL